MIDLYNGDFSEIIDSITSKLDNDFVIVTDPPFNIGYHYNKYKDNLHEDDYLNLLKVILLNNKSVVIHYPEMLYKIAFAINKTPKRVVSWVYNSNTSKQHRDIAFFDITPDFNLVRQPYKNLNDKRIQKRIAEGKTGAKLYDWWNINQVKNVSKEKTNHPCQMPLEVMKNIIGVIPSNYIIIDPFMGSGTTGVACKLLNRNFIGIELDEKYFNIAKDRIESASVEVTVEEKEEALEVLNES